MTKKGFTDEERDAMKERAQELKKEARRGPREKQADGEGEVLAKIAAMPEPDRTMAERLHTIVKEGAPDLSARTWYGMPAYAKDGCRLLLPRCAPVQDAILDLRLQRQSKARRRNRVACRVCAAGVDRRGRGKDFGAGEESGEMRRCGAISGRAVFRWTWVGQGFVAWPACFLSDC